MKKIAFSAIFLLPVFMLAGQTAGEPSFAEEINQHRKAYMDDFLTNDRSPVGKDDLDKLRFYAPDESYRVQCTFTRTPDEKPFELPTYSGITRPYVKYGVLNFELKGQPFQLAVYQNLGLRGMPQYAQHLFLPFRDLTNDDTTYGGGRYMDLNMADLEKDEIFLDFNKCYNPWCHYSDGYNCPIPPVENSLETAIEAGEKVWAGTKKHK